MVPVTLGRKRFRAIAAASLGVLVPLLRGAPVLPGELSRVDAHSLIQVGLPQPHTSLSPRHSRHQPPHHPWHEKEAPPTMVDNLCMYESLVPEFVLIGVVKSATTTFVGQLRESPEIVFSSGCDKGINEVGPGLCENGTDKEGHFFDYYRSAGPEMMGSKYPPCQTRSRMVAAEASARYFIDDLVPATIHKFYGRAASRINFMIMLREPVARFHSDFYHAKVDTWWCQRYIVKKYTFKDIVMEILGGDMQYTGGNLYCSDRLEASLYPRNIRHWFERFLPGQFTVVPMKFVTQPRVGLSVVDFVWKMLGVRPGRHRPGAHYNSHPHPKLEADLPPKLLSMFRDLIYQQHGPAQLADVFSEYKGAKLFGFLGTYGNYSYDSHAIQRWIVHNW